VEAEGNQAINAKYVVVPRRAARGPCRVAENHERVHATRISISYFFGMSRVPLSRLRFRWKSAQTTSVARFVRSLRSLADSLAVMSFTCGRKSGGPTQISSRNGPTSRVSRKRAWTIDPPPGSRPNSHRNGRSFGTSESHGAAQHGFGLENDILCPYN